MSHIGHNGGPELDAPIAWRTYAWGQARAALMPTLPIEVVRLRVKRAAELGLDYKTYAGVRAATGRDVIGFLFSSNALRVVRAGEALPGDRVLRLDGIAGADRVAVVQPPISPVVAARDWPVDGAVAAPPAVLSWPAMRDRVRDIIRARGLPPDAVLVVGETALEREWAEAGKTAGFLTGERYFGAALSAAQ
jgi:hypothetical protein